METAFDLKVRDRFMYKDGTKLKEAQILEFSPSRKYVRISFGIVDKYWVKAEDVLVEEMLEPRKLENDEG